DRARAARLTATYQVRLRGGPSFQVRFQRGTAAVGPPQPGAADCRLTVDPVTFLLVAYGRRSQWPGILRGQLRAWGRRPWLGPRFLRLSGRPGPAKSTGGAPRSRRRCCQRRPPLLRPEEHP